MIFKYPFKALVASLAMIILWSGFNIVFGQITFPNQTVQSGTATTPVNFFGTGCNFKWTNNTPGIGLPASGNGDIPSFMAVNNGNSPVTASITAYSSSTGFAYIGNGSSKSISVINTATNAIVTTIPLSFSPIGIAVSPDGNKVCAVQGNQFAIINTATNTATTFTIGSDDFYGVKFSPDGSLLYAVNDANPLEGLVAVISTSNNSLMYEAQVGINPQGLSITPDGHLYVANSGDGTVTEMNTPVTQSGSTIMVGQTPKDVVVSPDGSKVYVTNFSSNNISVIDVATNIVVSTFPAGINPNYLAISMDGTKLYVTNAGDNTVSVINTSNNTILTTIPVGLSPAGISITPDGTKVFVVNQGSSNVSVIDAATNIVLNTINAGGTPGSFGNFISAGSGCRSIPVTFTITVAPAAAATPPITVTIPNQTLQSGTATSAVNFPATSCVYNWANNTPSIGLPASGMGSISSFTAINNGTTPVTASITATPSPAGLAYIPGSNNSISVINLATNTVAATIQGSAIGASIGASVSPDGSRVYTTNVNSGNVSVINAHTNTIIATIPVQVNPYIPLVSPDGSRVYVTNSVSNTLSVINATNNEVIATVPTATYPIGLAISPDGKLLYISCQANGIIDVMDTQTNTIVKTLQLNIFPNELVLSSDGSKLYVSNESTSSVIVINTSTYAVITSIPVNGDPYGIALSPDGSRIYVSNFSSNTMSVISTATNAVIATVPVGQSPSGIALSPDGSRVYVSNSNGNDVSVINTANNALITTVPVVGGYSKSFGNFISKGIGCTSPPVTFTITVNNNSTPSVAPPKFTYTTPHIYPINSPITPLVPVQTGGAVPATEFGDVFTFAGQQNTAGYVDGTAANAEFSKLWGIDIDASGNLYVADDIRIRKITPAGAVTTLAGGNPSNSLDGTGTAAGFNMVAGLVVAPSGNIFVGDINNRSIRQITPAGVVTTFAGSGINNFNPVGITADQSGNLFVADQSNDLIRKFTTAGVVSIYAGQETIAGSTNGALTSATFNNPADVKSDRTGNLYVADKSSDMIREISTAGIVSTLAGTNTPDLVNGPLAIARFNNPNALALDPVNDVYIADQYNLVIRMINQSGIMLDIAGNNSRRTSRDGIGAEANFNSIGGIVYSNGVLFVTDQTCVRKIIVTGYAIDKPLPVGLIFDSKTGIISGTPTVISPTTTYTITGYNTGGNSSSTVTITTVPPPPPVITYPTPQVYTTLNAITPLVPTNTGGAAANYIIDKPLPAGLTLDPVTGIISGTPTAVSPATDYTITASNDGGTGSFTINITVIAKILPPQTITFAPLPTKTYGDVDFAPGATSTNSIIPITYTSDNTAVAVFLNGNIHITGAGTTNITASQAGNNDFAAANPVTQVLTVNKAPLTVIADNKTKPFGAPIPTLTATYVGFVYNDTPAEFTELPSITTTAVENSPVGQYPITVSGGISADYIINPVAGTLTITAIPPTIDIPNAFTPNGDGFNDLWEIKALVDYPHCMVSVYNRYGSLIYQSKGYARPWDGTYGGSQVPVGTYYYIIDPGNNTAKLSGSVTVLR